MAAATATASAGDAMHLLQAFAGATSAVGLQLAEAGLHAAAGAHGFGAALVSVMTDEGAHVSLRQLAGIILKEAVVNGHWNELVARDAAERAAASATLLARNAAEGPDPAAAAAAAAAAEAAAAASAEGAPRFIVSDEEKAAIRDLLPSILAHPSSKLRTAVGMVMAAIGEHDWPEQWPDLFPSLLACLKHDNMLLVHGALRCLCFFSERISTTHIVDAASLLYPELLRIMEDVAHYDARIRLRATTVFRHVLDTMAAVAHAHPEVADAVFTPILPKVHEVCLRDLGTWPLTSVQAALNQAVLRLYVALFEAFPEALEADLNVVYPALCEFLVKLQPVFVSRTVLGEEDESADDGRDATEAMYDSDGDALGLDSLAMQALVTFSVMTNLPNKAYRKLIKASLRDVVHTTIGFMQITAEQLDTWESDPEQFVTEEDDDSLMSSVRHTGEDLLAETLFPLEKAATRAICEAAETRMREAGSGEAGAEGWRLTEAAMVALGKASPSIVEMCLEAAAGTGGAAGGRKGKSKKKKAATAPLNLEELVTALHSMATAGVSATSTASSAVLAGRALWLGGRLARAIPQAQVASFFEVAVAGMEATQPMPVRAAACRALRKLVHRVEGPSLVPLLPAAIERAAHFTTSGGEAGLVLALGTLRQLIKVSPQVATAVAPALMPPMRALWTQFVVDPVVGEAVSDVIAEFIAVEDAVPVVSAELAPQMEAVLAAMDAHPSGVVTAVMEVLRKMVEMSRKPIPDDLFRFFGPMMQCVVNTADSSAMQSGADCLAAFVNVATDQIVALTLEDGTSAVQFLMTVIAKLLDPSVASDSAALYTGKLVSSTVSVLGGHMDPTVLQGMLHACATRLQAAQMPSLIQTLVLVFAHLILAHDEVCDMLAGMPVAADESRAGVSNALQLLGVMWVQYASFFVGNFNTKISSLALAKLVRADATHGYMSGIVVEGDELPDESERRGPRTRSVRKEAPPKVQMLPWPVRACVLLAREAAADEEEEEWDDEDDSDEDGGFGGYGDDGAGAGAGATGFHGAGAAERSPFAPADDFEKFLLSDTVGGGGAGAGASPFHDNDYDDDDGDDGDDDDGYYFNAKAHPLYNVDLKGELVGFFAEVAAGAGGSAYHAGLVSGMADAANPMERDDFAALVGHR